MDRSVAMYSLILPGYISNTTSALKVLEGLIRPSCRLLQALLVRESSKVSWILSYSAKSQPVIWGARLPLVQGDSSVGIPIPYEQSPWGRQLREAFGKAGGGTIVVSFHLESPWQQITSSFLPSPTLFKKKMGSNNSKQGLQLERAVETHLQLKNI